MNVSSNILSICFFGDKLSCITTPKSFSSFSIGIIFFPNLYVSANFISLVLSFDQFSPKRIIIFSIRGENVTHSLFSL